MPQNKITNEPEKRPIDANVLIEHLNRCIEQSKGLMRSVCVAIKCFVEQMPTVDAVPAEHFNALKSLVNGEWVDCKLVEEALGIDFATGLKMFSFSRTAEWNPAPLNGQKIITKFRLKNAMKVVRCGECQFKDTDYCPMRGTLGRVSTSDFCSYGERRQTDEEKQTNPKNEDKAMGGGTGPGNAVPSD